MVRSGQTRKTKNTRLLSTSESVSFYLVATDMLLFRRRGENKTWYLVHEGKRGEVHAQFYCTQLVGKRKQPPPPHQTNIKTMFRISNYCRLRPRPPSLLAGVGSAAARCVQHYTYYIEACLFVCLFVRIWSPNYWRDSNQIWHGPPPGPLWISSKYFFLGWPPKGGVILEKPYFALMSLDGGRNPFAAPFEHPHPASCQENY